MPKGNPAGYLPEAKKTKEMDAKKAAKGKKNPFVAAAAVGKKGK